MDQDLWFAIFFIFSSPGKLNKKTSILNMVKNVNYFDLVFEKDQGFPFDQYY